MSNHILCLIILMEPISIRYAHISFCPSSKIWLGLCRYHRWNMPDTHWAFLFSELPKNKNYLLVFQVSPTVFHHHHEILSEEQIHKSLQCSIRNGISIQQEGYVSSKLAIFGCIEELPEFSKNNEFLCTSSISESLDSKINWLDGGNKIKG